LTRQVLWNGNREPLSNFTSLASEKSVLGWAWMTHKGLTGRYAAAMEDPKWRRLNFVRLCSTAEASRWLRSISVPV